jgi:hypothetical protein
LFSFSLHLPSFLLHYFSLHFALVATMYNALRRRSEAEGTVLFTVSRAGRPRRWSVATNYTTAKAGRITQKSTP